MKIVFALLVLATCVSARFTISKIKADDGPCSELNISNKWVSFLLQEIIFIL